MWWLKIVGMASGINVKKMLGFVVKYWRECLIVLLGATFWYQNFSDVRFLFGAQTIPVLEAELANSQKNLRHCGESNDRLSDAIDKNNTRIDEYAQLTEDLEASLIILGNELTVERERTATEVEVILKDPTPKTCEKAIDYLRDGTKDLKW